MRTILITGASGFVGNNLTDYFRKRGDYSIITTSRSPGPGVDQIVDLTNIRQMKTGLENLSPDVIIHTAALSKTDICEKNREECYQANVMATENLVDMFPSSKHLFFSTYAVYNSEKGNYTEEEPVSPTNYYIETKIEAEKLLRKQSRSVILRPSVIFGYSPVSRKTQNYFMQLVDNIQNGRITTSPTDQNFNPILVDVIASLIRKVIDADLSGTYNIGSNASISKYEFNLRIMKRFGFTTDLLKGVDSASLAVTRPKDGTISSEKIQRALYCSIPSFDEMVEMLYEKAKDLIPSRKFL